MAKRRYGPRTASPIIEPRGSYAPDNGREPDIRSGGKGPQTCVLRRDILLHIAADVIALGAGQMVIGVERRTFITTLAGAAVAQPLAARSQQPAMPVVGFVNGGAAMEGRASAFRRGLSEAGYIEGQNITVEYHWLEGHYERAPTLMADLVERRVSVIATPGDPPTLAAKTATATIPIVFGVSEDPVALGLVASLAHPGGNATGTNFFVSEVSTKRLELMSASVTPSRPCHVSSPRHVERSVRISRTTLSCLLRPKAYGTYPAGATFGPGRRTR